MTTREGTFTVPHTCREKEEFFHKQDWDELHVVHRSTKVLVAVYSRAQVFSMVSRHGVVRKRSTSGVTVSVLPI